MNSKFWRSCALGAGLVLALFALAAAGCQPHYPATSTGPTPLGDVLVKTPPSDAPNQAP